MITGRLKEICERLRPGLIHNSSCDKSNCTSLTGTCRLGLEKSLAMFADIKKDFGLTTTLMALDKVAKAIPY